MGLEAKSLLMIDSYRFGRITVDGAEYTRDLIILPDRVKSDWWRAEGHRLRVEDLEEVLAHEPDVLVVGMGAYGLMKVGDDVKKALTETGILLKAERTAEACDVYNELVEEGKQVVAALHLTC